MAGKLFGKKSEPQGPLTKEEAVGPIAQPNSDFAQKAISDFERAKAALAKADVEELFAVYENAIRERNEMQFVMDTLVGHYVGKNKEPRLATSPDIALSMERVALAAIDLAKSLCLQSFPTAPPS